MRRGRAREPSLPCCDDPGVVVYSLFFLCLPGDSCGGKGGARSVHERSDGVMGVCVSVRTRVCVCGISIFLLSSIHHVSCCSMQKEKKGR